MVKLLLFSVLAFVFLCGGFADANRFISDLEGKPVRLSKQQLINLLNNDNLFKKPSNSSSEHTGNSSPEHTGNSSPEEDDDEVFSDTTETVLYAVGGFSICLAAISVISWFCFGCCCCCIKNKNGGMRHRRQNQRTTVTRTTTIAQANVNGGRPEPIYYNKEVEATTKIVDNFVSVKLDDSPPPTYEELHPEFNPDFKYQHNLKQ